MVSRRLRHARIAVCAIAALGSSAALHADTRFELEQVSAIGEGDHDAGQARVSLTSRTRKRLSGPWRARWDLRLESAFGDTGLGTIRTFDTLSRPWEIGDKTRLEIDTATLEWRQGPTRLTIGKQAIAWGVLDGLQVTDRLDAVRRRESVFTPWRPERISRWSMRLQRRIGDTRWDFALIPDSTVNQLPMDHSTFAISAPRLRAGLAPDTALPELRYDRPSAPTVGLRVARRWGESDVSMLVIHGPDTDPVIATRDAGVTLEYPERLLIGTTWQRGFGDKIVRAEVAWVHNQSFNVSAPLPRYEERNRVLAGVGIDWDLPGTWFVNVQVAIDQRSGANLAGVRRDEIVTMKIRRSGDNDRWLAEAELIGNLGDGDGTFRPSLRWQLSDHVQVTAGADFIWGEPNGLFGQYRDRDRVWVRTRFSW